MSQNVKMPSSSFKRESPFSLRRVVHGTTGGSTRYLFLVPGTREPCCSTEYGLSRTERSLVPIHVLQRKNHDVVRRAATAATTSSSE